MSLSRTFTMEFVMQPKVLIILPILFTMANGTLAQSPDSKCASATENYEKAIKTASSVNDYVEFVNGGVENDTPIELWNTKVKYDERLKVAAQKKEDACTDDSQ